jgi:hypothetical protein
MTARMSAFDQSLLDEDELEESLEELLLLDEEPPEFPPDLRESVL